MRRIALILFLFALPLGSFGQDERNPVVWEQQVNQISDTEYELVMQAKIQEGWHVYSQFTSEFGSLPSEFNYNGAGTSYELIDGTIES
jgi:thiol:disulfide interchange protein DsbD